MVSKRQKLARRRFKEEHPELFPKETPPNDPSKPKQQKKNKSSKFKRKIAQPKDQNIPQKRKNRPFRVPGMKPGESCFICKAPDHIAKNCPEKAQWEKNKICLFCRQRGHSLKNCSKSNSESSEKKLCYNCGDTGHSLANCPQPLQDGGTKFANCFICNEQGHLSKNCPKNTHGIYPKGGCCKICGGVTHLAKDCPNKSGKASNSIGLTGKPSEIEERPRRQVTKFISGDDLEDDFMTGDIYVGNKDKAIDSNTVAPAIKAKNFKSKGQKVTKVVNFVG